MVCAGYFSDDTGGEEENMEAFLLEIACSLIGQLSRQEVLGW